MAAILPYSSTAATLARNVTNIARPAASTIRKAGQGRVPNWKQVKQTGTGIKIRRRRRRGRRLRRRLRRRYRIRKRRYFNWLYKNRPIDYRSTQGATGVIYMYNMTMSSGGSLNYPSGSITYININGTMPRGFGAEDKFHDLFESASQSAQCTLSYKYDQVNYFRYVNGMPLEDIQTGVYEPVGTIFTSQGTRPNAIVKESEEVSGGIGNEPRGGSSATGSTPGPSSSFTILHDDN
ncbi:uncharacterized protein MONOS_10227 [Monocercomonoides exilis]|uniref:uncharacterized protein n=1 Tax=Monocercomonoides exilis TaxID=2049356 RepID=UPI00355A4EAA|nr:hypothetical protein MONOS_10227 [Monocercomonoides exilis]|eukprot:MONOS_10227.1-p1 / transcript=MONOS_10227.1 / gene=MONOS_10227 / organism=Monocercomonoides_exilis_PA203 / gene_product=unspecified product / transcript_product=unspecified product / location=Mono_scaffold00456:4200-5396(+) / protein_length=236 / sequence_SO=supercontig / SO=protein_coding / is_pseudo=false